MYCYLTFSQEQTPTSSTGTAAYLGHIAYQIQFLIDHCVWAKLYGSGSRDYNCSSCRDVGFTWGNIAICQALEPACVHETPVGVTYLLSAELLRVANEFEQDVICP